MKNADLSGLLYMSFPIAISLIVGALSGYWCLGIISTEAPNWAKLLLGIAVGGTAVTVVVLISLLVYASLKKSYTNPFLGVLYYDVVPAIILGIFGAIAGAIVMAVI